MITGWSLTGNDKIKARMVHSFRTRFLDAIFSANSILSLYGTNKQGFEHRRLWASVLSISLFHK
jgi:hypothetical protein